MEIKLQFPEFFKSLSGTERAVVRAVLRGVIAKTSPRWIIWGGSITLEATPRRWADFDFWCLVDDSTIAKRALLSASLGIKNLKVVHDAGHFPWFGELVTLLCFNECTLPIDIGFCEVADLANLNAGPHPCCVYGSFSEETRVLMGSPKYIVPEERRISRLLTNLVKIRKALDRGFLWNAIEYINQSRRELIGLIVGNSPKKTYYSRPDHDAERYLNHSQLQQLRTLIPQYSHTSITHCVLRLCDLILKYVPSHLKSSYAVSQISILGLHVKRDLHKKCSQGIKRTLRQAPANKAETARR